MGGNSSKELLATPLHAQAAPITAIDARYCFPTLVTLHLREKLFSWSGDDFAVKDAKTKQPIFRVDGQALSLRERKILCDMNKNPVAYMRERLMSFRPAFRICSDREYENEICEIITTAATVHAVMGTTFTDPNTGIKWNLFLESDWRGRAAIIWLGKHRGQGPWKRTGSEQAVARIYRPTNIVLDKQDYYMDVAPNVDLALMVLVCVALDERKKD